MSTCAASSSITFVKPDSEIGSEGVRAQQATITKGQSVRREVTEKRIQARLQLMWTSMTYC